jgi:phage tail sheath protein FI
MTTYKTPGVYVEEISTLAPSVAEVETAIPAFIGFTEIGFPDKGKLPIPLRITSLVDYQLYFGGAELEKESIIVAVDDDNELTVSLDPVKMSHSVMYYAMQLYFGNGGGPCYIASIGSFGDNPKGAPGAKIDGYSTALDVISKEDEPTLLVFPDAPFSLQPDDYYDLMTSSIAQCTKLGDRFAIIDVLYLPDAVGNDPLTSVNTFRDKLAGSDDANLKYGAAYFPYLNTNIHFNYDDSQLGIEGTKVPAEVKQNATTLRDRANTLKTAWEQARTDAQSDPTKQSLVRPAKTAYENADREATAAEALVTPSGGDESKLDNLLLNQIELEMNKIGILLTPCAAIAGVYASTDNARGVWKAPANVSLNFVNSTNVKITNDDQDRMNVDVNDGKSVNAIRFFTGKGIKVWGARTLDGNDNEWRYISVRRFFNMVEESVQKSTYWAVFESNDANTWVKVRAMIENYLILKWKDGALAGDKAEDAFFVRVGLGQTMTADDILNGLMIIEVGMAVVRPAEFIVLKFSHKLQTS